MIKKTHKERFSSSSVLPCNNKKGLVGILAIDRDEAVIGETLNCVAASAASLDLKSQSVEVAISLRESDKLIEKRCLEHSSVEISKFHLLKTNYDLTWKGRHQEDTMQIICEQRNKLLKFAAENNYDWILFLDSDVCLKKQTLLLMLQSGKDVVYTPYRPRWAGHVTVGIFDQERISFLVNPHLAETDDIVFECSIIGAGCTLIRKSLFDEPFIVDSYKYFVRGEDIGYSLNLISKNIPIYCLAKNFADHNCQATKGKLFIPRFDDNRPVKIDEEEMLQFMETGKHKFNEKETYVFPGQEKQEYSATHTQKQIWLHNQLFPKSSAFNTLISFELCSHIDMDHLRTFLKILSDRHSVCRTSFHLQSGNLIQRVHKKATFDFLEMDGSHLDQEGLKRLAKKEYQKPFDLEKASLFRVNTYKTSTNTIVVCVAFHHIISDGWSVWILLDELRKMYPEIKAKQPITLPLPKRDYKAYVDWESQLITSDEGLLQLDYWKNKMSYSYEPQRLPYDQVSSTLLEEGATHCFDIKGKVLDNIKSLLKENKISLNVFFLTVFHVLLHKLSGQTIVLTQSPTSGRLRTTAGRKRKDFHDLGGCFINLVVNQSVIDDKTSFFDLLKQFQIETRSDFKNQDYPFALLQEQLNLPESVYPRVSFSFHKQRKENKDLSIFFFNFGQDLTMPLGDLLIKPFYIPQCEGQDDLAFELIDTGEAVLCNLKYKTNLFFGATIKRFEHNLHKVITDVSHDPEILIKKIDSVSSMERKLLLKTFNDTKRVFSTSKTLVDLFEEQSKITPNNIAVVYADVQLTYTQINQRANKVAYFLQNKCGVQSNDLVGVLLTRSENMIIALLGILKSCAAYVPLDPKYPDDRIAYMVDDSNCKVLIAEAATVPKELPSRLTIDITDLLREPNNTEDLRRKIGASDLAYVIYTSGSTGKPKGVMVSEENIVNFLCSVKESFTLIPSDAILAVTTICFDIGVLYISPENVPKRKALNYIVLSAFFSIFQKMPPHFFVRLL